LNKIIRARLPKGFSIEIQESKSFLPHNVLVLINDAKQRLYVKICSKEDIAQGHIFEILSPTELKQTLNIEESYNGELYQEKGFFVVEESLPESSEEIEKALDRGLKKLKDRGKLKSSGEPVNIIISQKEDENSDRELTQSEKRYLFKQSIKEIAEEAQEEAKLERAIEEDLEVRISEDPVGKGGSGNLPLSSQQTGQSEGFDSERELVEYLVDRKYMGTPEQRKNASEILNKLYRKTFEAMKSGSINKGQIFEDDPEKTGESIIFRALRKSNERLRAKAMERREK